MRRLTIIPGHGVTYFRMPGLSIKASDLHELCKDEGGYYITNDLISQYNPRTAQISIDYLIKILKELHENLLFDKIRIIGRYELTPDEIMKQITI